MARYLRKQGYILISATTKEEKQKTKNFCFDFLKFSKVGIVEKMLFTKNLQVMISSGVPLPRALNTLSDIVKTKKFKKVLLEVKKRVVKGESFSQAISKYPEIFSDLFVNMIKTGEEAGTLNETLGILANQMEKEHKIKSKIKNAMLYPTIIIVAMTGIGILMLVMVVPNLAKTFEELNMELPITTKFIIFLGTFLAQNWYIFIAIVILFVFSFSYFSKTKQGSKIIDTILLKAPVFSPLIKKTNSASIIRTLGSLIASGVPIARSIDITSKTINNFYYKKALTEITQKIRKGEKLSSAMNDYQNIFPIIVIQMIKVGEETGETSVVLLKLAEFFEQEVSATAENLSTIIEPILMLIIGGAIGFFAVSMIQPMYSILEGI
ncbi:MAG: type II secretion system F family protein [Patescibacteria group bacterium]|nr:type II secretion system F family protein [Patescibacteria group bacterium]